MPIQTYFLEATGLGKVFDEARLFVRLCTEKQFHDGSKESESDSMWVPVYRRVDNNEEMTWEDAPPGATRLDDREHGCWFGPDGFGYVVKCPDGHTWQVDGQANNCDQKGRKHNCWIRHGDPRACNVTVDKAGDTCNAGAGSIQTYKYESGQQKPSWHGFLRNGVLVE